MNYQKQIPIKHLDVLLKSQNNQMAYQKRFEFSGSLFVVLGAPR